MRTNSPTSKTILYGLLGDLLAKLGGPRTKSIINPWRAGRRIKIAGFNYTQLGGMPGSSNYLGLGARPRPRQTVGGFVSQNLWKLNLPKNQKKEQPGFWHTLINKGWDAATEQTAQQFRDMSFWDRIKWSLGFATGVGSEKGPGFFQTLLTPAMSAYLAYDTARLYNKADAINRQTFNKYLQTGEYEKAKELFPGRYKNWQRSQSMPNVNTYHSFN